MRGPGNAEGCGMRKAVECGMREQSTHVPHKCTRTNSRCSYTNSVHVYTFFLPPLILFLFAVHTQYLYIMKRHLSWMAG